MTAMTDVKGIDSLSKRGCWDLGPRTKRTFGILGLVSDDLMTPIKVLILIKVSLPARAEGPCHPWLGRWKLAKTAKNTDSGTKKHRFIDNWQCGT